MTASTAIGFMIVFAVLILGSQAIFGKKRGRSGDGGGADDGGTDTDSDGGSDGGGDGGGD